MTKQPLERSLRPPARSSGSRPPLRSFRRPQIESLEPRLVLASGFAPLPLEVPLLSGAPLHLGLDGFDDEGDALTFTASISNAQLTNPSIANPELTASILQGNQSVRISVEGFGDMVAELFEQRAPRTTSEFIKLAEAEPGFYNDLIFHRIIQNFMIQGGDPLGDGTGGPPADFDDEFHPDLQHTSPGVFSMANSGDDTNGSQFFITAAPTRHLDYEHSIFGFLTEGESVRQAIAAVATDPETDKPLVDVVMSTVEIFDDTENAVLMLSAPEGTTGEADVTVAVSDGAGGFADQTFHVVIEADTVNAIPYLLPVNPVKTNIDTQATILLKALDVEGDTIYYGGVVSPANDDLELDINSDTGVTTVTPKNGLVGVHGIFVGARKVDGSSWDTQAVPVYIAPNAPTGLELISGSAVASQLTATSAPTGALHFRVGGLVAGAEVSLYSGDQLIGRTTAQSDSAIVETDPSFSWT
ncbi:MAG: peptidylprolyl isomerase, partial [Planctomycetota bacterium]